MTLLFQYLRRDSRAKRTWIARTIVAAASFLILGFGLIDDSGFGAQYINVLIVILACLFGYSASLTMLDTFRGNAWRETLEVVHFTRLGILKLFFLQSAVRSIPLFLGFLPILVLFCLVLAYHGASTSLWIRLSHCTCCAISVGLCIGTTTSCHSNWSSPSGIFAAYNTFWVWFIVFWNVVVFGYIIPQLWNVSGFSASIVGAHLLVSCTWTYFGYIRQVFKCRIGTADLLKLLALLMIPLFAFPLLLLPGIAFRFYVFPVASALYMAVLALVYVHLASQVVRDSDYISKSRRWRFLVPLIENHRRSVALRMEQERLQETERLNRRWSSAMQTTIMDSARTKHGIRADLYRMERERLQETVRLNRRWSSAMQTTIMDTAPSRPGIWADLYLSRDTSNRTVDRFTMMETYPFLAQIAGILFAVMFELIDLSNWMKDIFFIGMKDIFFIVAVEFLIFLGIMIRASSVLFGDRRSGILHLILGSSGSSRAITDGVFHSFIEIRNFYSILLSVFWILHLIVAHFNLLLGTVSFDWCMLLYVLVSFVLSQYGRFESLWILFCRDGLKHARTSIISVMPRFLTVIVAPHIIFLFCYVLIGNEIVRSFLCLLFPILHWRFLAVVAGRSMKDLVGMHEFVRE